MRRTSAGSPLEGSSFECTCIKILSEKYKYIFEINLSWLLIFHIVWKLCFKLTLTQSNLINYWTMAVFTHNAWSAHYWTRIPRLSRSILLLSGSSYAKFNVLVFLLASHNTNIFIRQLVEKEKWKKPNILNCAYF